MPAPHAFPSWRLGKIGVIGILGVYGDMENW